MAKKLINKSISEKTIYTYILRETLNGIIERKEGMELKNVAAKNQSIYMEVCNKILEYTGKVIGISPQ